MTTTDVARLLLDSADSPSPERDDTLPKVRAFIDRLILRLHSIPAYVVALVDVQNQEQPDGSTRVQLEFQRLPDEVIDPLIRLISAPTEVSVYAYVKDQLARTGIEFTLNPDDLPGDAYTYSL